MVMVGLTGFLFRCFRDASFRRNHQASYGSSILQGDADGLGGIDDALLECEIRGDCGHGIRAKPDNCPMIADSV